MAQNYKNFMKQTMQICVNTINEMEVFKYSFLLKQIGSRLFAFYKNVLSTYSTEWLLKLLSYANKITSHFASTLSKTQINFLPKKIFLILKVLHKV